MKTTGGKATIVGRPEGRPGIWLIDADTAAALVVAECGDSVHNFIESPAAMIGADWTRPQVLKLIGRPGVQIALVFPPNFTMRHQLVVIGDRRWAFDVGEIPESRMTEASDVAT